MKKSIRATIFMGAIAVTAVITIIYLPSANLIGPEKINDKTDVPKPKTMDKQTQQRLINFARESRDELNKSNPLPEGWSWAINVNVKKDLEGRMVMSALGYPSRKMTVEAVKVKTE